MSNFARLLGGNQTHGTGWHEPTDPGEGPAMGVRLVAGYFAVLVSAALFAFGALSFHIAGYVAGTLIAFTLAAIARQASLTLATETGKPESARVVVSVRALVVLGFVVGVIHAWYIARAVS